MTSKTFIAAMAAIAVMATTSHAQTLKSVRDRGQLNCGVSQGLPGFSIQGEQGRWTGFDADFCRTLAAAAKHNMPGRKLGRTVLANVFSPVE
jgi:ABC-type amino acid transport substrate-binding protein